MLAGELYLASDPELTELHFKALDLMYDFNWRKHHHWRRQRRHQRYSR